VRPAVGPPGHRRVHRRGLGPAVHGKIIPVHPIRHDRSRELGAFANPKEDPDERTPPSAMSPSYRNPDVARVPGLDMQQLRSCAKPLSELLERSAGGGRRYLGVDLHRDGDLAVPQDLHRHARMHLKCRQQRPARPARPMHRDLGDAGGTPDARVTLGGCPAAVSAQTGLDLRVQPSAGDLASGEPQPGDLRAGPSVAASARAPGSCRCTTGLVGAPEPTARRRSRSPDHRDLARLSPVPAASRCTG
jgi:hypothetical protein